MTWVVNGSANGPLTRYGKLRVAHALGMPGTFSPPPGVSDSDMQHGTCVTHVPCCMSGSLTNGFLWSRWRGKRSRHSRRMRNPQFYVSDKRPMASRLFGGKLKQSWISVNWILGNKFQSNLNQNTKIAYQKGILKCRLQNVSHLNGHPWYNG